MPTSTAVDTAALKDRVTKILTDPKAEWRVIDAEPADTGKLYRAYIAPLSAIPAVAGFIGMSFIGLTLPLIGTYRVPIVRGLVGAILSFVLGLIGVYVAAVIIEKLAPTFDSKPDVNQALKLVAYASTPVWVAGVLQLIPLLSPLTIIAALYAIYLFYLGLPVLMKTPQSKVIPYMAVSAVIIIVLYFVIGACVGIVTGLSAVTLS
jgi:hypothetical protein